MPWAAAHLAALAGLVSALQRSPSSASAREPPGAPLVPKLRLPLRTEGRFIVDRLGERVKWACTNWYGPESISFAFGGLEKRPASEIVGRILDLGFNCVRVPYSLEAHVKNPVIADEFVAANNNLVGSRFLDGFDAGIKALTDAGLMVIIDQHVSRAGYCCHWSQDEGLWYVPGYPEEVWIDSLVNMTRRYKSDPLVVAIDLRNEVHDLHSNPKWGNGLMITWGDGNPKTDWAAAATRAGNRVLQENADLLIVVMALCFGMELRPIRSHPITLDRPHRVVYQTHNYVEYQFWNLIPRDLGLNFGMARFLSASTCLVLASVLYSLLAAWRRRGKPRPSLAVLLISIGLWAFVFGLAFSLVAYAVFHAACTYCKWGASTDFLPWVFVWLAVALGGLLMAGLAWHKAAGAHSSDEALFEMERYALQSDASDEDEDQDQPDLGLKSGRSIRSPSDLWGDRGLLLRLQCFIVCTILIVLFSLLFFASHVVDSYEFNERWLDKMWGFALEEGQPYTAPVWMVSCLLLFMVTIDVVC
ncbi:unnamed protein product [Polarella glacialis]|uniref:Glycoside hydrolase family 5 domain-containing protein n=1 Tax=Polarella glacialis TaxID=89957 RepID=A0A813DZW6_POLGL|nr:unnamed protein product [Polarella glacialis]